MKWKWSWLFVTPPQVMVPLWIVVAIIYWPGTTFREGAWFMFSCCAVVFNLERWEKWPER
jgi:hypothetical protein